MNKKTARLSFSKSLAFSLVAAGSIFCISYSPPAHAVGTVPTEVQNGIDTAKATVEALNPLAFAALSVALLPLGSMLTLRFLNMVLSRV